jgi:hypothetical protein
MQSIKLIVQIFLFQNLFLQFNSSTIPIEAIQEGLKLVKENILQRGGHDGQQFATELKTNKFKRSYKWISEDLDFNLNDGTEYTVREFSHAAFAHLRDNVFGIDTAQYLVKIIKQHDKP